MTRYRCVTARKAEGFPVRHACEATGVSPSAYYDWLNRPHGPTEAEWDEAHLIDEMRDIHAESGEVYGSPRVTVELRRRGRPTNHKRVERLTASTASSGTARTGAGR